MDPSCQLAANEQFRFIMHMKNMEGVDTKSEKGCGHCLRWHVKGSCFVECSRANSHTKLSSHDAKKIRNAVHVGRMKNAEFRKTRWNNRSFNWNENQKNNQQQYQQFHPQQFPPYSYLFAWPPMQQMPSYQQQQYPSFESKNDPKKDPNNRVRKSKNCHH